MNNYEELVELTAQYLGISSAEERARLPSYVQAAAELCTMQTGQEDFSECEAAKRYVVYAAAQMYADRFGELSNKDSSAISRMMQNLSFALQTKNRRAANESNDL